MENRIISFSTSCINSEDIECSLKALIDAGIRHIELNDGQNYIPNIDDMLTRLKDEYNLNFLIHNYFPPSKDKFVLNLASQDKVILQRTIDHCKKALQLAHELKVPVYSVHAGFRQDFNPLEMGRPIRQTKPVSYQRAYDTFVQSLGQLCDYAGNFNVEIAVENHVMASFNLRNGKNELLLLCEADEFLQLFKDIRKNNLKALVDLGHLKVTAVTFGFDKRDFINKLKDKIALFHLSDNNGLKDTHEIINEDSWFWDILGDFSDARYVIESWNLSLEQIKKSQNICQTKTCFNKV